MSSRAKLFTFRMFSNLKETVGSKNHIETAAIDSTRQSTNARKKIVVFGGNGFVGQHVVAAAMLKGINVVSISRSGAPQSFVPPSGVDSSVEWHKGDILSPESYSSELIGATGVVSCIGAFGSNEFMEKMNGDANITAISECLRAEVPRFVYVSTTENNLPDCVLKGYFHGKQRAEQALLDAFSNNGYVLRPGFIYGNRHINLPKILPIGISNPFSNFKLPLSVVGKPLQALFGTTPIRMAREALPGMKAILAQPIPVDSLAKVAVAAAMGKVSSGNVLSVDNILSESRRLS